MKKKYPKISIIIPTLNADQPLVECLGSIRNQNYPQNQIEVIIIDGGSTDKTIDLAQKQRTRIFFNKLKTAEAGKAIGVRQSTGQYLALIDSDNILPNKNWLKKMILPLIKDKTIIGSEPYKFTYRKNGGFIERYSSLIGANDPYAYISGVYDRFSYLSHRWTGLKLEIEYFLNYQKVKLKPKTILPTIGANGTIFRADFLKNNLKSDYLFDIDILSQVINITNKPLYFAKVKIGIIHSYCESSINKFIRKQKRRLIDYYFYLPYRHYNWSITNQTKVLKFFIYTILMFPPIGDSIRGYYKKPDIAWFFHPLACYLSLIIFTFISIKRLLGINQTVKRSLWSQ